MSFSVGNGDNQNDDLSEINIIPLVDVMLVLLIIFMVTAPLSIGGININLPSSKAKGGKINEDRVVLSVTQNGEFFIEKMNIASETLEPRIKAIFQYRENKDLYIRADRNVPYGRVVDAMTAAKLAGVTKLSMLTQAPKKN